MDLQGKRRTKLLINILSEILNPSCLSSCIRFTEIKCGLLSGFFRGCWTRLVSSSSCLTTCRGESSTKKSSEDPSQDVSTTTKKYLTSSILTASTVMFFFTIIPFILDICSDIKIVKLYWKFILNFSNKPLSAEIRIPLLYLTFFLVLSIFLMFYTNPLKKMSRQLKSEIKLKNPKVEKNYETLSPSSLLQRYDLSVDESGMESSFQLIFQLGMYFSILSLLYVSYHLYPKDFEDLEIKKLKLWENVCSPVGNICIPINTYIFSGILGLFSLTMGQVKRNDIFNELNISLKQKIFYFFSSLFSTVSYLLLLITMVTSFLGWAYWVLDNTDFMAIASLLFTLMILVLGPGSLMTHSPAYKSKLQAPGVSWLTSSFTPLLLPTSQHITRGRYNIYNNSLLESPHLLRLLSGQCLAQCVFISFTLALFSAHNVELSRRSFDPSLFYKVYGFHFNDERLITLTLVMIPVGFLISHLLLWAYFKCDDGFFSTVNVDYLFKANPPVPIAPQALQNGESGREEVNFTDSNKKDDPISLNQIAHPAPLNVESRKETLPTGWQAWIEKDVEEDWYSWRKIKAWISCKPVETFQELNMEGYWVDLTGGEGDDEECEDGATVEDGEEGTIEHQIKMSFPFYRNAKTRTVSTQCSHVIDIDLD